MLTGMVVPAKVILVIGWIKMKSQPRKRKSTILWGMILLAAIFDTGVYFHPALTGIDNLNGLLGVWLGLFISAWPAANFLNMILYEAALDVDFRSLMDYSQQPRIPVPQHVCRRF
jgi:hypothetical protein